jgi:hypothetical protein
MPNLLRPRNVEYIPRSNSYRSGISFFQKLLYKINENEQAIDKITKELTISLKSLLINNSEKVTTDQRESGIYFNYPQMDSGVHGSRILNFHLTLHSVNLAEERHNKIHFSFIFNGRKYTYPLIQDGNKLSVKPMKGEHVAQTYIYESFNNNINIIILNTEKIIETILDQVDEKMRKYEADKAADKALKDADIHKMSKIASNEYIKKKGNAFKRTRYGFYMSQNEKAQKTQITDLQEIAILAKAAYEEYIPSKVVKSNHHNLQIDKIAKEAYEKYMKNKYPESNAENPSSQNLQIASSASSSAGLYSSSSSAGLSFSESLFPSYKKDEPAELSGKRLINDISNNIKKNNKNNNKSKRPRSGWGAGLRRRLNQNAGSKEKNKLNSIKTKYLREYCKKNKLKGYSDYNKKDLINFIKNNVTKKLT